MMERKLSIGEVGIYAEGHENWREGLCGEPRIAALRSLYRTGSPTPGYVALVWNPRRIVTRDMVDWESAGARVTGP